DQVPQRVDGAGAGKRIGEDGGGLGAGLEREPLLDQSLVGGAQLEERTGHDAVSVGVERPEEERAIEPGQSDAGLSAGAGGVGPSGNAVEECIGRVAVGQGASLVADGGGVAGGMCGQAGLGALGGVGSPDEAEDGDDRGDGQGTEGASLSEGPGPLLGPGARGDAQRDGGGGGGSGKLDGPGRHGLA